MQYPIQILEEPLLIGTLKIRISLQRETAVLAQKHGIDEEELQNAVAQKEGEISALLGDLLGGPGA